MAKNSLVFFYWSGMTETICHFINVYDEYKCCDSVANQFYLFFLSKCQLFSKKKNRIKSELHFQMFSSKHILLAFSICNAHLPNKFNSHQWVYQWKSSEPIDICNFFKIVWCNRLNSEIGMECVTWLKILYCWNR